MEPKRSNSLSVRMIQWDVEGLEWLLLNTPCEENMSTAKRRQQVCSSAIAIYAEMSKLFQGEKDEQICIVDAEDNRIPPYTINPRSILDVCVIGYVGIDDQEADTTELKVCMGQKERKMLRAKGYGASHLTTPEAKTIFALRVYRRIVRATEIIKGVPKVSLCTKDGIRLLKAFPFQ